MPPFLTVTFTYKKVQPNSLESVQYGGIEVPSDIVLLASVNHDRYFAEKQFAAECDTDWESPFISSATRNVQFHLLWTSLGIYGLLFLTFCLCNFDLDRDLPNGCKDKSWTLTFPQLHLNFQAIPASDLINGNLTHDFTGLLTMCHSFCYFIKWNLH